MCLAIENRDVFKAIIKNSNIKKKWPSPRKVYFIIKKPALASFLVWGSAWMTQVAISGWAIYKYVIGV